MLLHRSKYESRLSASLGTPDIKVLKGVRRCGKSSLLKLLSEHLVQSGVDARDIYYQRMDQFGVPLNPDAEWLERELLKAMEGTVGPVLYVLLDEIQDVDEWEKVVRRLHTAAHVEVFITGSNAHVLSSDLSTLLGGRYTEIATYPLSFAEYREFELQVGESRSVEESFARYVRFGGMPAQFEYAQRDDETLNHMLGTVYETIILNDVAMHERIGDMDLLAKLVRYCFSTSGSLFSTRSIVNALTSSGRKTTSETVDNYLRALENALIVRACEQEGLAGKRVLRPQRKYYPVDTGLRNLMTGFSPRDYGAQLECVVHNELIRRGYGVTVGVLDGGVEVDFVARRGDERLYIQVSDSLESEDTYLREVRPFGVIADSFPKRVLTLGRYRLGTTEEGVVIENLVDWLLAE